MAAGRKGGCLPIAIVTGSRAEFGLLAGTISALHRTPGFEPHVIVAGMHLEGKMGNTWREVAAQCPVAARVDMSPTEDSRAGMARAVARGLEGFLGAYEEIQPALLLVLGDRIEPFAAVLAAVYSDVPVAHIHGGDLSGHVLDDYHRDAISRAACLHFAATEKSAERLRSMSVAGEIEVVGAPGLDEIMAAPLRRKEDVLRVLKIPCTDRLLVVLHHPLPEFAKMEEERAGAEMAEVLAAAVEYAAPAGAVVVLYPNNDAGSMSVITEIEKWQDHPLVNVFPSLPRNDFLALLASADALVGNSSSGIIESVSLGVPAVNVGSRQAGRERNPNVVDAPPEKEAIIRALAKAQSNPAVRSSVRSRKNLYGDGHAATRIVEGMKRFLPRNAPTLPRVPPPTVPLRTVQARAGRVE